MALAKCVPDLALVLPGRMRQRERRGVGRDELRRVLSNRRLRERVPVILQYLDLR